MDEPKTKEEEFEDLVNRFTAFIKIHIHKFNPYRFGIDPDDIAQEVRIKLWHLLHREKNIANYASYIKKIVNSSVIDQLRKLRRDEGLFFHEKQRQVAEQETNSSAEFIRYRNLEEVVGFAVESLMESRRQVVKLYLLNLSIQEIAAYLGWSTDKTRNLLYRGLSDLKTALREVDAKDDIR